MQPVSPRRVTLSGARRAVTRLAPAHVRRPRSAPSWPGRACQPSQGPPRAAGPCVRAPTQSGNRQDSWCLLGRAHRELRHARTRPLTTRLPDCVRARTAVSPAVTHQRVAISTLPPRSRPRSAPSWPGSSVEPLGFARQLLVFSHQRNQGRPAFFRGHPYPCAASVVPRGVSVRSAARSELLGATWVGASLAVLWFSPALEVAPARPPLTAFVLELPRIRHGSGPHRSSLAAHACEPSSAVGAGAAP